MLVAPPGSDAEFPLWPPLLAARGPGGRSAKHAHHALHVMLAIQGELRVRGFGDWRRAAGVVTAPDALHEIDATGLEVLLVFLDPESAVGATLVGLVAPVVPPEADAPARSAKLRESARSDRARRQSARAPVGGVVATPRERASAGRVLAELRTDRFRLIAAAERDQLVSLTPAQLMGQDGLAWTQRVVNLLGAAQPSAAAAERGADRREMEHGAAANAGGACANAGGAGANAGGAGADARGAGAAARGAGAGGGAAAVPRLHPGVRRALRHLRGVEPSQDHSLAALAKVAGLSEGRFMHAFTESIGIPLRPYLAWLKLQRAAAAIVTGSTLSEAAYGAGFADAAHMTRAFRRMFGVRPSELRKS